MKMQIVKEAMETGNNFIVARKHDIASSLQASNILRRMNTIPLLKCPGSRLPCNAGVRERHSSQREEDLEPTEGVAFAEVYVHL